LLKRLSSEPWSFASADSATRNFAMVIQNDAKLWPAVINVLRRENGESSQLALAYLVFSIQNGLTVMQSSGSAESSDYVKGVLKQIESYIVTAEEDLENVANSSDAVIASRAHFLLADRNLSRREYSNAQAHLRSAIALEPESVNLKLAQVRAFIAAEEHDQALEILNNLQRNSSLGVTVLSNMAKLVAQITLAANTLATEKKQAQQLLEQAWRKAQFTNDTSVQEAERVAFALARVRIGSGQTTEAATLYNGLANASHTRLERAAALLDWEAQLRTANKTAEADAIKKRHAALSLSPAELQNVRAFLNSL
jgi:hypothetical protein